ncbi:MAG: hypothetical protein AAB359_00380 [Elusimicrobiota bacterium]
MTKELLRLLKLEIAALETAAESLAYSHRKCVKTGIKKDYTQAELESFEAFTSRFARVSDILIQKVFRLIDKIELEDEGTVRDRINRAEKKGLIPSAGIFAEMRILRNDIPHEYQSENLKAIYKKTLEFSPHLTAAIAKVKDYCKRFAVQVSDRLL